MPCCHFGSSPQCCSAHRMCFHGFWPSEWMRAVPIDLRHACLAAPIALQLFSRAWNTWGDALDHAERMKEEEKWAKTDSLWYTRCVREKEIGREKKRVDRWRRKKPLRGLCGCLCLYVCVCVNVRRNRGKDRGGSCRQGQSYLYKSTDLVFFTLTLLSRRISVPAPPFPTASID